MSKVFKNIIPLIFSMFFSLNWVNLHAQTDLHDLYLEMKEIQKMEANETSWKKQDYIFYSKDSVYRVEKVTIIDTFYNCWSCVRCKTKDGKRVELTTQIEPAYDNQASVIINEYENDRMVPVRRFFNSRKHPIPGTEREVTETHTYPLWDPQTRKVNLELQSCVIKRHDFVYRVKVNPDTITGFYLCSMCERHRRLNIPYRKLKPDDLKYYKNIREITFLSDSDLSSNWRWNSKDSHPITNWINSSKTIERVNINIDFGAYSLRGMPFLAKELSRIKKPLSLKFYQYFDRNFRNENPGKIFDTMFVKFPLENIEKLLIFKTYNINRDLELNRYELYHISRLKKLEKLYIMGDFFFPESIKQLKKLKAMVFYPAFHYERANILPHKQIPPIPFPTNIGKLKNLEALYINCKHMHEIPEFDNRLKNLKLLVLDNMENIRSPLPESFKNFKNLKYLILRGLNDTISISAIKGLPIHLLEAKDNKLSPEKLDIISQLKNLQYFAFSVPEDFNLQLNDFHFSKVLTDEMRIFNEDVFLGFTEEYYSELEKEPFIDLDFYRINKK